MPMNRGCSAASANRSVGCLPCFPALGAPSQALKRTIYGFTLSEGFPHRDMYARADLAARGLTYR